MQGFADLITVWEETLQEWVTCTLNHHNDMYICVFFVYLYYLCIYLCIHQDTDVLQPSGFWLYLALFLLLYKSPEEDIWVKVAEIMDTDKQKSCQM